MAESTITSANWVISPLPRPAVGRRSAAAAIDDIQLDAIVGGRFEVDQVFHATSPQRRGVDGTLPAMDVTVPVDPGSAYVLAVRHEGSGALSFHGPKNVPVARRGAKALRARPATLTFEVRVADPVDDNGRRSLSLKTLKGIVLKAAGGLADLAVPWIGSKVEDAVWKQKNLPRGWLQVTPETLGGGEFAPADFTRIGSPTDRCLLLLHGTFSDAAGAFKGLVSTRTPAGLDFFSAVNSVYGDRIYAFNHFSVSQTPEQNAIDLIAGLPIAATFDVITHSRGGLVLRNLVERQAALGPNAGNFQLGKAVLVASPNIGTPLATADRFEEMISWWANLIELFPVNPWTTTAAYIGEALMFIARHVVDALPGLESMDMKGTQVTTLNLPPGPADGLYSTLVSNYQPTGNVLARILDLGIDAIFNMANDLVVPSEGGWKVNQRSTWVSGARIGCFGLNMTSASSANGVIHTTYFSQPETVDFLLDVLLGKPLGLAQVDPDIHLPFLLRRSLSAVASVTSAPALTRALEPLDAEIDGLLPTRMSEADDVLHLFLISADGHIPKDVAKKSQYQTAILLATYRNARVVETIFLRGQRKAPKEIGGGGDADFHWNKIIGTNIQIKNYVDGKAGVKPPNDDDLHEMGVNLFNAMFPGTVRRLYDAARVDRVRAGERLNIVITSMINWVADKPWEFAYDRSRQSFLATESVNFTRNVLTAVPADEPEPHPHKPLLILVVVAQPVGLGQLSAEEEQRVVQRGFQELIDAGLATVEFMMRAHIDTLHKRLGRQDVDILHFVGHGEYNEDEDEGYLVFEDPDGAMQRVSAESLRQVLCQRKLRLVFLNACETGTVGLSAKLFDFNRGVAPKLVAGGIPILVANQYKVLDVSATEFAKHFYRWLAHGSTVGDAAREARVAVNYSVAGENIDWAVPVVYARNPGRMIYTDEERDHAVERIRQVSEQPKPQPCKKDFKGTRVGLWDVNHVLPRLDDFASTLNGLQKDYCFQSVELSAPLGTWRRTPSTVSGQSQGYIQGKEVALKIRDHVANLGVEKLICVTAFALADQQDVGLGLWNLDDTHRVAIISAEMIFSQPEQPSPLLNRFLANMLVCALCGIDNAHDAPPPNCPNHNPGELERTPEARFKNNTAFCEFCPDCKTKLGDKVNALNQILARW